MQIGIVIRLSPSVYVFEDIRERNMASEEIMTFLAETGRMIVDKQIESARENGVCDGSIEKVLNLGTQAFERYNAMKNGEITKLE